MGKGGKRRPSGITREEEDLRWDYAMGKMTLVVFNKEFNELKQKGLIKRDGKVVM